MSWFGAIVARVWLIASADDVPGGSLIPGGRTARNASDSLPRPVPPHVRCSAGPGTPPSTSSPRTVVFPSRKGSESAKSIRKGRPPTSTLLRFRTADAAVSWSENSQNPYPLGFPVSRSNTNLNPTTCPTDLKTSINCSSPML